MTDEERRLDKEDMDILDDLYKAYDDGYNQALDDFIQYAYIKGIDFSFMGRTMENGESDVPARLKKIKDDFLEQKKGTEENG